ncbi:response regulator transcription factor [Streptomyces sp. NPDC048595]|uniref:response regulator n=1 Tax=Streptomyces sp. NPDC048595 TaxID=3365576 RepID=UPI0037162A9C
MIRVLVTDDEPRMRAGIRKILTSVNDIDVIAEAANCREAIELSRAERVDVVLLDLEMPVMDGLSALAEFRQTIPDMKVIMLATFAKQQDVFRALSEGSVGLLLKDSTPAQMICAVRTAAVGGVYLSPGAARHVVSSQVSDQTARRTEARAGGSATNWFQRGSSGQEGHASMATS